MKSNHDELKLGRKDAARYLSMAPSTLAKLATMGGGPYFNKVGRNVKYKVRDLDVWLESRTSPRVKSTSEYERLGFGSSQSKKGSPPRYALAGSQFLSLGSPVTAFRDGLAAMRANFFDFPRIAP